MINDPFRLHNAQKINNPTNIMKSLPPLLAAALLLLGGTGAPFASAEESGDGAESDECAGWAEAGECSLNPSYMAEHCAEACKAAAEADRKMAAEIEEKIGRVASIFELEAEDVDGNVLKFETLKGKVTVITNVASYCGYTESHYAGMVELHERFRDGPVGFDVLAFPCNQFGEQEPKECPEIKRFARSKGAKFTVMDKVDVNGIDAHPVYHYLKKVAGPPRITWNFATYYIVAPDGTVSSKSGVEPGDLVPWILEAMGMDDEASSDEEEEWDEEEEESEDEEPEL
ncbi:hypothetical protein ACHAWF_014657 [Thalassiosira exigua]